MEILADRMQLIREAIPANFETTFAHHDLLLHGHIPQATHPEWCPWQRRVISRLVFLTDRYTCALASVNELNDFVSN